MSDQVTRAKKVSGAALSGILAIGVALFAWAPSAQAADEIFTGQNMSLPSSNLTDAARDGDLDGLRNTLLRGIPPDDGGIEGVPALVVATINNHLDAVKLLLEHGANPNRKARDGRTALSVATQHGRTTIVSTLLQAGANPNQIADHGDAPLFIAVRARRTTIVQMLLDYDADIEDTDITGRTVLDLAEERHYDDIAQLLRKAGA